MKLKNILLILVLLISQVPTVFYGTVERMQLSLFVRRIPEGTRMDFVALYYCTALDFLILGYCLWRPKGVNKNIALFIFIMVALDFLHLLLFAKQGYGILKMGLAIVIYFIYELTYTKRNG